MTIDMDSTICEVARQRKQGAAFGYTRVLGYHPVLATRAETGEVLHARLRKGSSPARPPSLRRGARSPGSAGRGATGPLTLRADSGFWSYETDRHPRSPRCRLVDHRRRHQTVRAPDRSHRRDRLADHRPTPTAAQAQVAETTITAGSRGQQRTLRLIVRRTRLTGRTQAQPWPDWRHHAFITSLDAPVVAADEFHRDHATVELAIRDLKEGAGLEHCPSGHFFANAAWLACAVLAHNLTRWTARLGGLHPADQLTVTRTIRTRAARAPWPARQPQRPPRPTTPRTLAMGQHLHHRTRQDPLAPARDLTVAQRTSAAATTPRAHNPLSTITPSTRPHHQPGHHRRALAHPRSHRHTHKPSIGGSRLRGCARRQCSHVSGITSGLL